MFKNKVLIKELNDKIFVLIEKIKEKDMQIEKLNKEKADLAYALKNSPHMQKIFEEVQKRQYEDIQKNIKRAISGVNNYFAKEYGDLLENISTIKINE